MNREPFTPLPFSAQSLRIGVSRNGTQNAARCTSESDFAPTTNSPVADGFAKTDGSDDLFSKTTSSRAYIGVFEEVPSDPSAHRALAVE